MKDGAARRITRRIRSEPPRYFLDLENNGVVYNTAQDLKLRALHILKEYTAGGKATTRTPDFMDVNRIVASINLFWLAAILASANRRQAFCSVLSMESYSCTS